VSVSGHIVLNIYDVYGRKIKELVNKTVTAGVYTVEVPEKNLLPGIYFVTLSSDSQNSSIKIIKIN
jgi:hypothetical protein